MTGPFAVSLSCVLISRNATEPAFMMCSSILSLQEYIQTIFRDWAP